MDANGLWFQKKNGKQAVVHLVNNLFRYQVFELWLNQRSEFVSGPLLASGYKKTLALAKKEAFIHLEK